MSLNTEFKINDGDRSPTFARKESENETIATTVLFCFFFFILRHHRI